MSQPILSAEAVQVVYGKGDAAVHALKGVCLDVRAGEVLMLKGPSGSGKTSLVQVMGALLRPSAGMVRLAGERIDCLDQRTLGKIRRQHFGFVFQSYNLFPALTAAENVAVALDLKTNNVHRIRQQSMELLDSVGLADRSGHFPAQLSGGQKQRVAIARALAGDPNVIFADEPTGALDSASGLRVISLLRDLASTQQRAVVIVTHDPRIMRYADRIVPIEDGRIGTEPLAGEQEVLGV